MRILVLALALIVIVLGAHMAASVAPPKHVDPALIREKPPLGLNIITIYRLAVALASEMNFTEALLKIKEMEEAYMPRELSYAYKRFTGLLRECISHIEGASILIDEAESMISKGEYSGAERSLNAAEDKLRRAERILDDLLEASRALSRIIPREGLASGIERLGELVASLKERASELRELLRAQLMEALDTKISVKVTPLIASPGQVLNVEGELREASGAPIAGRRVTVIAGSSRATVLTDDLGRFKAQLTVVDYTRVIEVRAAYTPMGTDRFLYKPSVSEVVPVEVLFYTPRLKAELRPERATPGGIVEVYVETEPGAKVKIVAFNEVMVEAGAGGLAIATILVPEGVEPGDYNVTVSVLPERARGPAGLRLTLTVYKMPLNITVEFPDRVMAGSRIPIRISAQTDSIITVCVEGVACERTTGVNILIEPQIPIIVGDYVNVVVRADPLNPAYTPAEKAFQVNVINWISAMLSIALLAVAIAIIAFPVFKLAPVMIKGRTVQRGVEASREVVKVEPQAGGDIVRVLIDFVARVTGVSMLASRTLREFLLDVRSRASWVYEVILKPIMLLERALYGRPVQTVWEDLVREASEALEKLRRAVSK